ncbi:hypothetical protein AGMMS50293_25100 [Spirochaetia bacterium]|nr:hypothetical protein AGMMS50293_25100 [Spirochaetia bacterium]
MQHVKKKFEPNAIITGDQEIIPIFINEETIINDQLKTYEKE